MAMTLAGPWLVNGAGSGMARSGRPVGPSSAPESGDELSAEAGDGESALAGDGDAEAA
jgi:hypothetical protein